jgi:hypothetical protein
VKRLGTQCKAGGKRWYFVFQRFTLFPAPALILHVEDLGILATVPEVKGWLEHRPQAFIAQIQKKIFRL